MAFLISSVDPKEKEKKKKTRVNELDPFNHTGKLRYPLRMPVKMTDHIVLVLTNLFGGDVRRSLVQMETI